MTKGRKTVEPKDFLDESSGRLCPSCELPVPFGRKFCSTGCARLFSSTMKNMHHPKPQSQPDSDPSSGLHPGLSPQFESNPKENTKVAKRKNASSDWQAKLTVLVALFEEQQRLIVQQTELLYRRLCCLQQLLTDPEFMSQYGGERSKALTYLHRTAFCDVMGVARLEKLLGILDVFPRADMWKGRVLQDIEDEYNEQRAQPEPKLSSKQRQTATLSQVRELQAQLTKSENRIAVLEAELEGRDRQIESLRLQLESKDREIASKDALIAVLSESRKGA